MSTKITLKKKPSVGNNSKLLRSSNQNNQPRIITLKKRPTVGNNSKRSNIKNDPPENTAMTTPQYDHTINEIIEVAKTIGVDKGACDWAY